MLLTAPSRRARPTVHQGRLAEPEEIAATAVLLADDSVVREQEAGGRGDLLRLGEAS